LREPTRRPTPKKMMDRGGKGIQWRFTPPNVIEEAEGKNVDAILEFLIELQETDAEITRLENLIRAVPDELGQHGSALAAAKAGLEAFHKSVEAAKKERLLKEGAVETKTQGIAKAKLKLNEVKTNQEYNAALAEIENMKRAVSKLDDEQLEIMERLESAKADEKALKEQVAREETEFAKLKAEKEALVAKLSAEAKTLAAKRAEIAAKVDPAYLSHYDRIYKVRENKAVAGLKNGYCQACYQSVLPQLALEVRMGTVIHKCPHCLRFLYFVPDEEQETRKKVG
jgi:predicted  nucleic acid-binding Zn-ribbon protein